jgi:hypothetical protein
MSMISSGDDTDAFFNYMPSRCEYPDPTDWEDMRIDLTRRNTGWKVEYVAESFLSAWTPYLTPVVAFLISRYEPDPFKLAANVANMGQHHTRLGELGDDVALLCRPARHPRDEWWYLWFDCDSSDCALGRFSTDDSPSIVEARFRAYMSNVSVTGIYGEGGNGMLYEIPVAKIKGWWGW